MSMMPTFKSRDYNDGRTKQAFKDSCDINKILAQAAVGNSISHLAKHGAVYGDFSDIDDLLDAHAKLQRGHEIFADLPGEVKREFQNDAGAFFKFVNDPANVERLPELIPDLAKPGNQMPAIARANENIDQDPVVQRAEASPPEAPPEGAEQAPSQ